MSRRYFIPVLILGLALFSLSVRADVVVLKTGKKFDVEKVWRENDKIWIIFQGMRASIPPSKVARIERKSNRDSAKMDPKKEETSNLKKMPRSTPPITPPADKKSLTGDLSAPAGQN